MLHVTAQDFRLANCQASIFMPDGGLSVSRVVQEFLPRVAAIFDGDPTILGGLPAEAPAEIPRVILQSSSRTWQCEVSLVRTTITWRRTGEQSDDIDFPKFFSEATDTLLTFAESQEARVGRLASAAVRFARHDTPGLFLAKHFCRNEWIEQPFNRPENFEIHAHKEFQLAGTFQINSWARSKTGKVATGPNQPIILFEQDLNTLAEDARQRVFAPAEMKAFYTAVASELDTILDLYFPKR